MHTSPTGDYVNACKKGTYGRKVSFREILKDSKVFT